MPGGIRGTIVHMQRLTIMPRWKEEEVATQMNKVWTLFPDEESVTETEEDENSENSEDDGEIKEEIDPWATMIDDAKATVRPEYDEFMKTLQMDGQEESAAKQEAFESVLAP